MNLACIVFQSSDYSKVALEAETYRTTFRAMGHGFDILLSTRDSGLSFHKLPKPDTVEGRYESKITVDGVVSHHPNRAKSAGTNLNTAYDAVLFVGLCPYPTRAYGTEPHWLALYDAIKIPKIGKVVDLTPGTDWPEKAINKLDAVYYSQDAFVPASLVVEAGDHPPNILPTPYLRHPLMKIEKTARRSVIWSGGWNRVDGIVEFIHEIPKIGVHSQVALTGIGSQYFRQRKKDHWVQAVSMDSYADFDGNGPAKFVGASDQVGYTPGMASAWAAVDLVGMCRGELHPGFSEGLYTPSMIEALYKGTWPVVSMQCAAHSIIPAEYMIPVMNQEDIAGTIGTIRKPLAGTILGDMAREWVTDTHDSYANSATLIQDIGGMK